MQTKNVNQVPLNNAVVVPEKNHHNQHHHHHHHHHHHQTPVKEVHQSSPVTSQHVIISPVAPSLYSSVSQPLYLQTPAPPLPPRVPPTKQQGLLIVAPSAGQSAGAANLSQGGSSAAAVSGVDLDGYGPYKPVPPPKPLPPTGFQPPPYRMPPQHPEQHELPGAMMQPEQTHGPAALQTHSNKFPIEREVIVTSSVEKSSSTFKARILPEFRGQSGPTTSRLQPVHSPRGQHRPPPGAIAPDAPTRHLAWTPDSVPKRVSCDAEQLLLSRGVTEDEINRQRQLYKAHTMHDVSRGPPQDPYGLYVRSPYHPSGPENPYMYRQAEGVNPRGPEGVPRMQEASSSGQRAPEMVPGVVFSTPTPRPRPQPEQEPPHHRPPPPPTTESPKKFPAKTYHTIKDMISTRFGAKEAPKEDDGGFSRPAAEGKSDEPIYHHQGVYTAHRLKAREAGDGGGRASAGSSDYEKHSSAGGDSGRGPSAKDTSTESSCSPQSRQDIQNGESEWVDMVESELRQILDPRTMHTMPPTAAPRMGANSNLSESVGSMTPPLPPLSPSGSPCASPKANRNYKSQPNQSISQSANKSAAKASGSKNTPAPRANPTPNGPQRGWNRPKSMPMSPMEKGGRSAKKEMAAPNKNSSKIVMSPLHTFGPPDSTADMTSTTTGLDLDSVLDGQTENTSDDDDDEEDEDDISTTVDTTDAQAIRRQLEGLENMYSEVLKMLGVKKYTGGGGRYVADTRPNRRRLYGSMSSLPSSVSSRPVRERRGRQEERKKVKDIKGINKRFQRLESHVVTLARSVAHLSSEMRTQHLMLQEIENIREEVANLRATQPSLRAHSAPRITSLKNYEPSNPLGTNTRIKKLTKFFGDEPPLLRLFLRKLGYEKYATNFESEKVGLMELPYVSEERLQKMGIPLGPRLRILQEAQVAANACANQDSTFSVYVV
ncbi:serine/arginine repetitive matrix protein 1-like isoform X2 [Neocloeon triangulifer]|nr:serine/arginine repetitive matrix protein 1-like isoform X2 [Neocloeon triangulifer]